MTRQIQILKNGSLEQTLNLEDGSYTLGRSPNADIVLSDNAVSKTHALLTVDQDRISITDKGSANGIFFRAGKSLKKP
ncbi:MAG: FHA domain-containing protein [Desulfobacterales bacterium]